MYHFVQYFPSLHRPENNLFLFCLRFHPIRARPDALTLCCHGVILFLTQPLKLLQGCSGLSQLGCFVPHVSSNSQQCCPHSAAEDTQGRGAGQGLLCSLLCSLHKLYHLEIRKEAFSSSIPPPHALFLGGRREV